MSCNNCHGSKWYTYTTRGTSHGKPCEYCCEHKGGPWKAPDTGKYYCFEGCGTEIPRGIRMKRVLESVDKQVGRAIRRLGER